MKTRSPAGVGEATKCSLLGMTHSTAGLVGPALPSVLPVRWALPRYVVHPGSAAGRNEETNHRGTENTRERHMQSKSI